MADFEYEQSTRCFPTRGNWAQPVQAEQGVLDENTLLRMYQASEIGWAELCMHLGVSVTDTIRIGNVTIYGAR